MTLVRCPTHGIPYNDQNPRGCPACAQERQGRKSQAAIMKELAEASVPLDEKALAAALEGPGIIERIREALPGWGSAGKNLTKYGPGVIVILIALLFFLSRPTFVVQPDPVEFTGSPQPLAIMPGQPITIVQAVLGSQQPAPHPRHPGTTRYSYGTNLVIDEVNGFVYSIEVGVPNRTWKGLQVGIPEQQAHGALALLGTPRETAIVPAEPEIRSGYVVYARADGRPIRTVAAQVRPPNGCYDAAVELRPRQLGILVDGDDRYSAVSRKDDAPRWVVTRILVTDRSRSGANDDKAC